MKRATIIKPTKKLAKKYSQFLDEYMSDDQSYYTMLKELHCSKNKDVSETIRTQCEWSQGKNLPEGWFPMTTLWLVFNDKIVGEALIRHKLNPMLEKFAGHVTYYILPQFRGCGLAKALFSAAKEEMKVLNIDKAILCSDQNNIASQKVIEASGGVYLDTVDNSEDWGEITHRYLVDVKS